MTFAGRLLCLLALVFAGCTGLSSNRGSVDAGGVELLVMFDAKARAHFRPDGVGGGYGAPDQRSRVMVRARAVASRHHLTVDGDWPMPSLGIYCVLVHIPADRRVEDVIAGIEAEPGVAWAQRVQDFHVLGTPDPYYRLQTAARELRLDAMHDHATGRGISVAQIDTGVDTAHPDLAGRIAESANFVDGEDWRAEHHGTAIAGIIAGTSGNRVGIVGVAPEARLYALRACRESGDGAACTTFSLAKAMEFAIQRGVRIVNLSLTGPQDRLLAALIDRMARDGTIVVGAVDRARSDGGFPASHRAVVAAGSSRFVIVGKATLVAPGNDVLTALPAAQWGYVTGDSFAAAHISGLAALFSQRVPKLDGPRFVAQFRDPSQVAVESCPTLAAANHGGTCR